MKQPLDKRIHALNELLANRTQQFQELEEAKNKLLTEVVKIQGKLEVLKELQAEESVPVKEK